MENRLCRAKAEFEKVYPESQFSSGFFIKKKPSCTYAASALLLGFRLKLAIYPLLVILALMLAGSRATAQSASIDGSIADSSNAAVTNASIDLLDPSTQTHQKTEANGSGFYSIPNVMPGLYTLTIMAPGFETQTLTSVGVTVGAKVSLNFVLKVGSQSEQVSVDGSGAQINTTDAGVSTVIGRKDRKSVV